MVLNAAFDAGAAVWIWAVVLLASLISVVGFARAGSVLFWKAQSDGAPVPEPGRAPPAVLSLVAVGGLLALLVAHTVFAGKVYDYTQATAEQLFNPETYVRTVLETKGKLSDGETDTHAAHAVNADEGDH